MTRRSRAAWIVAAIIAGTALIVAPPVAKAEAAPPTAETTFKPAASGKSFEWEFTGSCCITSRSWPTTRKADITITSTVLPCERGQEYRILLQRKKRIGWASSGNWRYFHCTGKAVWEDRKVSTYRFRLEVAETAESPQREGFGGVYFDGAKP